MSTVSRSSSPCGGMRLIAPAPCREAAANIRRDSTTSARSCEANFSRTAKLIIRRPFLSALGFPAAGGTSSLVVQALESGGKLRQHHGLVPIRTGGDHSDFCSALLLLKPQILLRRPWQLIEIRNSLGRLSPTLQRCVDRFDLFQP